jgi:PAS domain S-box-containing protein
MFHQLFELSADAIFLFDPGREIFVDCNQAAVAMMRATSKQQLLMIHPAELSPEFQPDGKSSREKTPEVINLALGKGSHRFEWRARGMDGVEFPLEVLLTPIQTSEHPLMATVCRDISERKAGEAALRESERKFRELFEASTDAIQILDPMERRIVDCNAATVVMAGGESKEWLLKQPVESLSPERQPDGRLSREVGRMWAERALTQGPQRFEWIARRGNGGEFPVEILLTPVQLEGRKRLVSVSRDISERKKTERELLDLNQSLERHVAERTAALTASEARFRALVEHAPEAIVVFDGDMGRIHFGNEHACRLYGVPMEKLAELTPADVSPEFQAGGRRSSELAREKMDEALNGGMPVFEWIHRQQPSGRLIPTEVRLLRLPADGQNLIRASIIDNTERKLAERALRESEEKFRALFERSSQGVVLHDEEQILEVNPAAVRILGCQSSQELVGKHPGETSPPLQPNGESSAALSRKYIQECMAIGNARFEWMSRSPQGKEIPLEVTLTRIQWSGRQVIQALISDIRERKRAETELRASEARLRESEARFSAAFRASPVFITISGMEDGRTVLANEAFLKWTGYRLDEVLGRNSLELGLWANPADRETFWEELRRKRSIHERECRVRNRHGKVFTMLISADIIEISGVSHLLTVGLDII